MNSVLLVCDLPTAAEPWRADLSDAGFHLLGAAEWNNLVREALRTGPSLLVVDVLHLDDDKLAALTALHSALPLPVLLFTRSPDAQRIEQALAAGVSAYVINARSANRLRPLAHLATARFRHEQALRTQLADLEQRFGERKLVDRAKGVLMRARQISEEEAFRMLRVASMHANRRVGQISQQVVDSARYAEAINQAGQLRMLAQQLIKHAAFRLRAADPEADGQQIAALLQRGENNLQSLGRSLSEATYGDLLTTLREAWQQLSISLTRPAGSTADPARRLAREQLAAADLLAEHVLQAAERLTGQLEHVGVTAPLRVINLSGRQRMLSQRLAKQVLLGSLLSDKSSLQLIGETAQTESAFDQAMVELEAMPLSSLEIRADLAEAGRLWQRMRQAVRGVDTADGLLELRTTSDGLLALFQRLTQRYEHSLQMLIG